MAHIPYGRQDVVDEDVAAVVSALRSEWLTQGPEVPRFENAFAEVCGAGHAVAVNSATSALHIACLALGLGRGDWLWTSPITFVASANCALYCGASVDFVDIDPRTYNLSADALAVKLAKARKEGRLPKIVVAVHLAGQSCEMAAIRELGQEYGFHVIEDASHAVGGSYRGAPVGSCQFSDITVFSFHPVKIITSAEGGMALTNDAHLAQRMALFRSHGVTREPQLQVSPSEGPWYYEQIELGFNYRMTDLQAALGLSQSKRLGAYVRRRHEIAARYNKLLSGLPVKTPWQHPESYSAFHLYVVRVEDRVRRAALEVLRANDIGANVHYIPVYKQPYYRDLAGTLPLPEAERYYSEAMSLPMFAALTEREQDRVVDVLAEALHV